MRELCRAPTQAQEAQMTTPSVPARALAPYLSCADAGRAIDFYRRVFGAVETMRLSEPNGRIGHAELRIGEDMLMVADEYPEMDRRGPLAIGGTPVTLHLYVTDADATVARAVAAGATIEREVADQFYGDRSGSFIDPFGHRWHIATRRETLTAEQIASRYRALIEQ
jgi:PhnB protein